MQVQTTPNCKSRARAAENSTDSLLRHAVQRHLRGGQERVVLALHLSQLLTPGPRPHHRRIARAILDDAAQAHSGQMFPRSNGDLVLICEPSGVTGLVETLTRLFRVDAPAVDRLLDLWLLPQDADLVQAYAEQPARLHSMPKEPSVAPAAIAAIESLMVSTPLPDLVHRQTAVEILPTGLQKLYREVTFSVAALEAGTGAPGPAQADPFLFRHLATRMDARMLDVLSEELAQGSVLAAGPALHLNLTLAGILSPAFLSFAAAARRAKLRIGAEISLLEVCADPLGFAAVRMALRAQDCAIVLDAVSHPALLVTTVEALEPDLVKLDWTPRLTSLASRERRTVADAIDRLGPGRIVLHRADTEAALDWGRGHGISRFQGRQIDAMLAAARLSACRHAKHCTLRECIARGAAIGAERRAGCRNTPLLDAEQPAIPA
jgi:hypothetical protein